jgi:cell wall-associated protease
MSWGDTFVTRLLDDVVRYAASQNVVLVASAGNSSSDLIHYPSGFEPVISVGASTAEDYYAASFTNYGPTIDLVAPGQEIVSTTLHSRYDSTLRGTSFSAPYVSAAAALVLSQHPYYSPTVVRDNLTATADDRAIRVGIHTMAPAGSTSMRP